MKAKKYIKESYCEWENYAYSFNEERFKAFCKQLCKEQRDICQQIYYHQTYNIQRDLLKNIGNAPMPEL